ncbi:hypothetical protein LX32DRAFT_636411 [Colletotrichum zoysiae]|uniref:Uncharacterized protein n=1 Tax=Colletotrichum zoysiae TaxID=1216348 RepID=A0AAD9M866_9PEZI|nr:hypothetical protein LX32DRAFT_636411 [Colletotrichum zoysiae]
MAVQLQSDVNALGFAGLSAFSTVLSAMSADNIHPSAMLQLENLGSLFHVNGKNAGLIPEVLKNAVSHPIGRLSISVGWRRGDTVSILGETAGGQAISLLMTALAGIYVRYDYGLILSSLCSSLLPKSMPASNPMHLADVADLVAAKATKLSIGNLLAEQTHRVLSVYDQLGKKSPKDLLEIPATESIVRLFECLSNLQQDRHLVRVSGSIGIVYLATLILFMFPQSAMIAVESVIILDNEGRRIIIEIAAEGPTKLQVETELSPDSVSSTTPITKMPRGYCLRLSYLWDGWVPKALHVELGKYGLILTQEFLEAFCQFVVRITPHLKLSYFQCQTSKTQKTFKELLGHDYQRRISTTFKDICHYTPDGNTPGPVESWLQFSSILVRTLGSVKCTCGKCEAPVMSWRSEYRDCPAHHLSRAVGSIFSNSIMCCVLEPQGPVAMNMELFRSHPTIDGRDILRTLGTLGGDIFPQEVGYASSPFFGYEAFLNLNGGRGMSQGSIIGKSSKGSSIYPAVLEDFKISPDAAFTFRVYEGAFIYEGRYYEQLSHRGDTHSHASEQQQEDLSILDVSPITRSALIQPLSLTATLRGGFGEVLVSFSVQVSGYFFSLDAFEAVLNLMCLDVSRNCAHDVDSPLPMDLEQQIVVRKVGMSPIKEKINIYMTHGDRRAQFLAGGCVDSRDGCLLLNSCLSCGVQQAREGGYLALIVA